jgi:DNA-binding MarR family transcriptional regulator
LAIITNEPKYDMSGLVMIELRKIIQAIDRNSKSLMRRVGLTMPQLIILHYICRQTEASVGVIAMNNSLSDATVTGILERLERRGLIAKRKSTSDRRRVLVKITETGKEMIKKAPPAMQEGFVNNFSKVGRLEPVHDLQCAAAACRYNECQFPSGVSIPYRKSYD